MKKARLVVFLALICAVFAAPCYAHNAVNFEKNVKEALINRNWGKAAEIANAWKQEEKTAAVPHLILAYIYYADGNFQKIPGLLEVIGARDKKEALLAWAQDFVREYPQNPLPYLLKGDALMRLKDYSGAIKQFETAEQLGPCIFLTYIAKGACYAFDNKYDLAIENFSQAIRLNPGLADALNSRGIAYFRKGDYTQALSDFDQAIKINPAFSSAYLGRAKVYGSLGKDELARSEVEKAREISKEGFAISNTSIKDPTTGKLIHRYSAGLDIKPEFKTPDGQLYSFGRLQGVDSAPEGQITKIKSSLPEGRKEEKVEKILADNYLTSALSFLLYNDQLFFKTEERGK